MFNTVNSMKVAIFIACYCLAEVAVGMFFFCIHWVDEHAPKQ